MQRPHPGRVVGAAAATVLLAAALAAATGGTASALALHSCVGSQSSSYTPALTNTTQQTVVEGTETLSSCPITTAPGVRSGTISFRADRLYSCLALLTGGPVTRFITWNTGQTSTFSANATVNIVDGQLVVLLNGTITAGLFVGAAGIEEATLLGALDRCDDSGVSSLSGPVVLRIVNLL